MQLPNPNCYWVIPGHLMAGEYPRDLDAVSSRQKLAAYIDCGVSCFVDLTEAGELAPYAPWLAETPGIQHHRFAIRDKSVPADRATMRAILDCIANAIMAGHIVYVHCWGGVGRTGTVVACYLMEQGYSAEQALAKLALLWQGVAKSARLPRSPETEGQREWVMGWGNGVVRA